MAGTPLSPTSRYIPAGTREVLFVPVGGIANINAPTRAELEAGTNLTDQVADYDGWALSSDFVDTPDLGHRYVSQIPGQIKAPSSSLTLYADVESDDVRTLLPQDTLGFIVIFGEGDGPANGGVGGTLMDVWPIQVGSEAADGKIADPGQRVVSFASTAPPALNVAIPAAS